MMKFSFQKLSTVGKIVLVLFLILIVGVAAIMMYLAVTDMATAKYVVKNHAQHYLFSIIVIIIGLLVLRKKLSFEQYVIYLILPSIIAGGWPDIVYFVSYLVQNGTYEGVLLYKNDVYRIMHKPLASLSAGPVITLLVYWYDRKKPLKYWYWPIIMLIITAVLSLMHVVSDWFLGF